MQKKGILLCFILLIGFTGGVMASEHMPLAATPLDKEIVSAIKLGRYADAIQLIRGSSCPCAEKAFSMGDFVLQGWADSQAQQRPLAPLETGIGLLEEAALAGRAQAISSLAGLFYTGLRDEVGGRELVAQDAALQACWEAAKTNHAKAQTCVALRTSVKISQKKLSSVRYGRRLLYFGVLIRKITSCVMTRRFGIKKQNDVSTYTKIILHWRHQLHESPPRPMILQCPPAGATRVCEPRQPTRHAPVAGILHSSVAGKRHLFWQPGCRICLASAWVRAAVYPFDFPPK